MSTLFVISNINLETVRLVASCIKKRHPNGFDRIVFFETPEAEKNEYNEIMIYREYFGTFEKNVVILNTDGSIPTDRLYSVMNITGEKVIDLSNGPKVTSSALYFAATLCRIQNIYCMILHGKPSATMVEGKDYEYIRLQQMQGIEQLARLSYFDLVYYTEDINRNITLADRERSLVLRAIYEGMIRGVTGYFSNNYDARTVINNLTLGNENLVEKMLKYLRTNRITRAFAQENNINLYYDGDPIGILSRFCKIYVKTGREPDVVSLCTVTGLLSGLRDYRNISAHYTKNHVILTDEDARTVINMELTVIKCMHNSVSFWEMI